MPLLLDLRHSFRSILKAPGFLVASTLSLALGIGVNTAAFSALNAVFAPRLAREDPQSLVFIGRRDAAYPMLPDTLQVSISASSSGRSASRPSRPSPLGR